MRPIKGTVTDPCATAGLFIRSDTVEVTPKELIALEQGTSETPLTLDEYQQAAAETAIYPRVYVEDQVKQIVWDVVGPYVTDTETGKFVDEQIEKFLDARETPFNRLVYPILGAAGEIGELCNKAKKIARDNGGKMDLEAVEDGVAELGDIGWYFAAIATELRVKLSEVAKKNLAKLASRKERGVLGGSGDNR